MNLLINLRNLWLDLATWTRNYTVSVMSGFGNTEMVGNRLYQIPIDFNNRLQLIFGAQSTQQLVNLLSQHIILMMTTATALKDGDQETVDKNVKLLYQNSSDLAVYFEQINPYWSDIQWGNLLDQYVSMTLQEMFALASGNFEKDINIYDRITYFTVLLADYMTSGIMQYLAVKGAVSLPQPPENSVSQTFFGDMGRLK
jgi:hypothetical protein